MWLGTGTCVVYVECLTLTLVVCQHSQSYVFVSGNPLLLYINDNDNDNNNNNNNNTCGRLISWLFTQHSRGVKLGTTENKFR